MSEIVEFVLANLCRVLGHPGGCALLIDVPVTSRLYLWAIGRNYVHR